MCIIRKFKYKNIPNKKVKLPFYITTVNIFFAFLYKSSLAHFRIYGTKNLKY